MKKFPELKGARVDWRERDGKKYLALLVLADKNPQVTAERLRLAKEHIGMLDGKVKDIELTVPPWLNSNGFRKACARLVAEIIHGVRAA